MQVGMLLETHSKEIHLHSAVPSCKSVILPENTPKYKINMNRFIDLVLCDKIGLFEKQRCI